MAFVINPIWHFLPTPISLSRFHIQDKQFFRHNRQSPLPIVVPNARVRIGYIETNLAGFHFRFQTLELQNIIDFLASRKMLLLELVCVRTHSHLKISNSTCIHYHKMTRSTRYQEMLFSHRESGKHSYENHIDI